MDLSAHGTALSLAKACVLCMDGWSNIRQRCFFRFGRRLRHFAYAKTRTGMPSPASFFLSSRLFCAFLCTRSCQPGSRPALVYGTFGLRSPRGSFWSEMSASNQFVSLFRAPAVWTWGGIPPPNSLLEVLQNPATNVETMQLPALVW